MREEGSAHSLKAPKCRRTSLSHNPEIYPRQRVSREREPTLQKVARQVARNRFLRCNPSENLVFIGEKYGAPGGTRTPDLLVRRFGFEILRALSVCQLRVGRFEICPLIGLHGLQHLRHCVTHFILRTDVAKNPEDCEQGFHIPRLTAVLRLRSRLCLPSRLLQSRQGSDEDKFGTVMAANV